MTNVGMKYEESEAVIDVCQAVQDMRMESERNGELKKAQEAAINFYAMGLEVEKIAEGLGQTVELVKQWLGLSAGGQ